MSYHDIQARHLFKDDLVCLGVRGTYKIVNLMQLNNKIGFNLVSVRDSITMIQYEIPCKSYLWALKVKDV